MIKTIAEKIDSISSSDLSSNKSKQRFRWIDQIRGTAIFYLVLCNLIHWPAGTSILDFFFSHAERHANYMTLRDITTSTFIFIMGFLYGYIFRSYERKYNFGKATRHIFFRYGMIFLLGILASFLGYGTFIKEKTMDEGGKIAVMIWDVLPTIGLAGLVGYPFLFLKPKWRFVAGYAMLLFYQIMLSMDQTSWRLFAIYSVHGGVLGTIFSFSAQLIIASALGEYYFSHLANSESKTYKTFMAFAIFNLVLGLSLAFIPDLGASKRQVSFGYSAICMGATILLANFFVFLEKKNKISFLLDAFGKNPFLIYLSVLGWEALLYEVILRKAPLWLQMGIGFLSVALVIWLSSFIYKRFGIIKTETVVVPAVLIIGISALISIPIRLIGKF